MDRNSKTSELSRRTFPRHHQCGAGGGCLGWACAIDGGGKRHPQRGGTLLIWLAHRYCWPRRASA